MTTRNKPNVSEISQKLMSINLLEGIRSITSTTFNPDKEKKWSLTQFI